MFSIIFFAGPERNSFEKHLLLLFCLVISLACAAAAVRDAQSESFLQRRALWSKYLLSTRNDNRELPLTQGESSLASTQAAMESRTIC